MNAPTRPLLRYFGGKWMLAPWIVRHLPPHRIYVDPFGGAGSVLLRKPRSHVETWNDVDGDVVNLFQVLRDKAWAAELIERLELTPYARDEYRAAQVLELEPVERARRLIIRSFMGHGPDAHRLGCRSGFRAVSNDSGRTPARDWENYPPGLAPAVERLSGVVIESRPAVELILAADREDCLFYVDPPYVWGARTKRRGDVGRPANGYAHELSDEDHARLLAVLFGVRGMVAISGYPSPLYDAALYGWRRIEREARSDGMGERTEFLWLNPAAADALDASAARKAVAP